MYASTISLSETSQSSTSCLRMRWRSRSNGPSNTGVRTAYDIGSSVPAVDPRERHPGSTAEAKLARRPRRRL